MREYVIDVGGLAHTVQMPDDDAKALGLALHVRDLPKVPTRARRGRVQNKGA